MIITVNSPQLTRITNFVNVSTTARYFKIALNKMNSFFMKYSNLLLKILIIFGK